MPARKLVVIPYNLYQDLIGRTVMDADVKEEAPLTIAKKELTKVKRRSGRRAKDLSQKNLLYQQKLRNYLRARKRLVDKPVKVKLSNGANVIMQPSETEKSGVALTPIEKRIRTPLVSSSTELEHESPENGFSSSTSNGFLSVSEEKTPPKIRRQATQKAKNNEKNIMQTVHQLYQYIKEKPKEFGLTKTGMRIIDPASKTGKAITNSFTTFSLEHIIRGPLPGSQSPPGTSRLRAKLKGDPIAMNMIHHAGEQIGKGKKKSVKFQSFRPTKW